VVYVELPKIERQVTAKEPIAVVRISESGERHLFAGQRHGSRGEQGARSRPGLDQREPYGQGWIFVLKIENPDDLKNLKDASGYKKQIG